MPYSEILGSKFARNSPRLIAASRVLHRRFLPRHPPYALNNFNPKLSYLGLVSAVDFSAALPRPQKSRVRILVSHSTKLLSFPIISTVVKTFAIARGNCSSILPLSFSPVKHLALKKCCFFAMTVFLLVSAPLLRRRTAFLLRGIRRGTAWEAGGTW